MRRRIAIAAAALLGSAVSLLIAPSAEAASVCVSLDLNLNGTPVAQAICLPPEGAPGLPGLPALPLP